MSSSADRSAMPNHEATVFDRYRITGHLHSDARGECYLAEPLDGGRNVEVRFLSHTALRGSAEALWRSIGAAIERVACVDHPNVERVISAGVAEFGSETLVCVIAEHVEGKTLDARMREKGRLGTAEALAIGQRIGHGLGALHRKNVVHGDLRPGRILLTRSAAGDHEAVVLCDVGVSNLLLGALPEAPSLLEIMDADFVAPEQIEGEAATSATDIYALGLVLYRMLTGSTPFAVEGMSDLLVAQLNGTPIPMRERGADPDLPAQVEALVLRCLAKRPESRFESMQSLLKAVRECEAAVGGRTSFATTSDLAAALIEEARGSKPPQNMSMSGVLPASVMAAASAARPSAPPGPRASSVASVAPAKAERERPRTAAYVIAEVRREITSSKRWFLAAAGLTLVCGLMGGFVLATLHQAPAPARVGAPNGARAHTPATIHVLVRSNTQGAEVLLRGRTYPVPLRVELAPGTTPEMLEVTAPGRAPRRLWMMLDCNTEAQIDLTEAAPPAEPSAPPPLNAGPALTSAVVNRVVQSHLGEVNNCLNRARTANPALHGRVPVSIVIDPAGRVKRAAWSSTDPTQQRALGCITSAIRRWEFPASNYGGDFTAMYSFDLD